MEEKQHESASAPGALRMTQAFVNTGYGSGRRRHEELETPEQLRTWLTQRQLLPENAPVSEGDVRRAISVREALRTLLRAQTPAPTRRHREVASAPDDTRAPTTLEAQRESGHSAADTASDTAPDAPSREALGAAENVLNAIAAHTPITVRFHGGGHAALEPDIGGVDGALARLLATVPVAQADGSWRWLKICRNDACGRAFYDTSKNHSGMWCAMGGCGNRLNARASRARRRQEPQS